jgi:serine/threonine-protein kinase
MLDSQGAAALTDFGLARGAADTVLTKSGRVVGTVDYLAPEVILGEPATPASDVYALGCVVYECLTGRAPFGDRDYAGACLGHVRDEPADPATVRADVPVEVSWAALRALAKRPTDRPATGRAYARLLEAAARAR